MDTNASFTDTELSDPDTGVLRDSSVYQMEQLEDSGEQFPQAPENDPLEGSSQSNYTDGRCDDLFFCTFLVHRRQFKGQSSGTYVARWEVSAGSKREFIRKIWNLSKDYLAREVVFSANSDGTTSPSWSVKEKPIESDFDKFVLFLSGRRNYTLDKISEKKSSVLQSWRGKEISLLLHIYSLSISSRAVWNSVKDALIDPAEKDRSGAAVTHAVFDLADELRTTHGDSMDGHGMAWSFWANAILNAPAHLRESMKDYPPQHLAHLFRAKEAPRMEAVRRELNVAHSVNHSYHEDITALRQVYDVLENGFENLGSTMRMLKQRLEALEIRDKLSESLISAMETSVAVQEDQQGKTLSLEITDMDDVDHQ